MRVSTIVNPQTRVEHGAPASHITATGGQRGIVGPQGPPGEQGEPGEMGPSGDASAVAADLLALSDVVEAHLLDPTPHPAYDDLPSFTLLFENGIV